MALFTWWRGDPLPPLSELDGFHAAAVAAGGISESAPSLRPHDRVRYYATFIADPDGNRIEAVTFLQDGAGAP